MKKESEKGESKGGSFEWEGNSQEAGRYKATTKELFTYKLVHVKCQGVVLFSENMNASGMYNHNKAVWVANEIEE